MRRLSTMIKPDLLRRVNRCDFQMARDQSEKTRPYFNNAPDYLSPMTDS